ncbi:MAG: Cadmium-transporting ATPase [Chlamydiales bacterium]|nr:Cadmium-transporting ATPase [Chlamydiales bacterium]MCH9619330.1 Cadmium-transporting ATPase [Chlamydiales bacterium]MCH9622134.1 Cadmium-transporting ATPase [Chlamydiales bacterium]
MKIAYKVAGLDCVEEVSLLKKQLLPHVEDLEFNVLQAKMVVVFDPAKVSREKIEELIAQTGMKGQEWSKAHATFWEEHGRLIFTGCSLVSIFIALLSNERFFYLAAIFFGVWFVLPKAFFALRRLSFDMNLLMVVAICGAVAIHQWFEGATVAFLFSLALLLEQWSVKRAHTAISSLMELSPLTATLTDGRSLPVEEVAVGERLLVKPGEKVPLDGKILAGRSSVDESTITGESIPVAKGEGDLLYAGTMNQEGALDFEVLKGADETVLARIIALVEEARLKRSNSEQWVETFARYYTPVMFLFAFLVMVIPPLLFAAPWVSWIYRGLVLLVIACPCALVISTPVSMVSGLTAAARQGVLIKGGIFLEEMGRIKAIALDKTGTLTRGEPKVQEVFPFNGHTEKELLERAVALEWGSEHPLARAILSYGEGIETEKATNFQIVKGKGAQALYLGKLFWIGSHRYMHEVGQENAEIHEKALEMEDAGHSVIAIGNEDHVCGLISIADMPREQIGQAMEEMKLAGVEEIIMLTGDNEKTAAEIAKLCGISYKAELLPEDKLEEIYRLKKRWEKVAMVGDGVNDAPSMAAATLGIAMGKRGTDVALETSDIALMADDLRKLPWLIGYSKRVLRTIRQNVWFALGVKLLFVMLALSNLATLWMAIAADTGATLVVIFNALTLCKVRRQPL